MIMLWAAIGVVRLRFVEVLLVMEVGASCQSLRTLLAIEDNLSGFK